MRWLLAANPTPMTLDGTRTFLIGRKRPVVIDPGPASARHLAAIVRELDGQAPIAILLTHAHADHAEGAEALAQATGAPVLAASGAGYPPGLVTRWIAEGSEVETDSGSIRAIATPGHTPEHLAYLWSGGPAPERGALFVGDLFLGVGDTTLVAPPEGELLAYLRSLDRVAILRPGTMHPSHGPMIADPLAAVNRYRAHRMERIAQVKAAVAANPRAPLAELVSLIYGPALNPALVGSAKGSVLAVLEYLGRAD